MQIAYPYFCGLNPFKYSHFAGHIVVAVLEDAEVHKGITTENLEFIEFFADKMPEKT